MHAQSSSSCAQLNHLQVPGAIMNKAASTTGPDLKALGITSHFRLTLHYANPQAANTEKNIWRIAPTLTEA